MASLMYEMSPSSVPVPSAVGPLEEDSSAALEGAKKVVAFFSLYEPFEKS